MVICPACNKPTFINRLFGYQVPGPQYGESIEGVIDPDVEQLWMEVRSVYTAGAYTAVGKCCRSLLAHVAVAEGADRKKSFAEYVDYLTERFLPNSKDWIDRIREIGNETIHEFKILRQNEAKVILDFTGMLLKVIYEYPAKIKPPKPAKRKATRK